MQVIRTYGITTPMPAPFPKVTAFFATLLLGCVICNAEIMTINIQPQPVQDNSSQFKMGTPRGPGNPEITVNGSSLMRDGKPWLPVMGEFHFSRYPANEWKDELLKMKAGGIDIAATYVFWIHHEEEQGKWDWAGQRSLREFILRCKEAGMPVIVRMGPWCHGEVRNGGLPEWVVTSLGRRVRSDDPEYMTHAKALYQQIADQIKGLLWKDGGPVVGVQVENEFRNPTHLLNLKKLAREMGIDTPIYTRTGWPALSGPITFGEILPLYGAYAEGFWDRGIQAMPGNYWQAFVFRDERINTAIATDSIQANAGTARELPSEAQYPYLTCELGGGMMSSYHRRILIDPRDISSVALTKVGSGSNLPGYYMYHGGTNPEGKLTTLNEAQNTKETNHNDLPIKTYDFQAPLGEFGQMRPHYHLLRRLHLFLRDFGDVLAPMQVFYPSVRPSNGRDNNILRWSVRSDGTGGFIFVNNYQRLLEMPDREKVQFDIKLAGGNLRVPLDPTTVPEDASFVWPFNLDLGGAKLTYATAQPVCKVQDGKTTHIVFSQTTGVPSEFVFDQANVKVETTGKQAAIEKGIRINELRPGNGAAIRITNTDGRQVSIIVLDEATSLQCWRGEFKGQQRIFLTDAGLMFQGDTLKISTSQGATPSVAILPPPQWLTIGAVDHRGTDDGLFRRFAATSTPAEPLEAFAEVVSAAGPLRQIKNGARAVPEQPSDAEFNDAAVWKIKLPQGVDTRRDLLLRIRYTGDVARLYLDGKLILDNFYNGREFDIGLRRYGQDILSKELVLKVLPLQKNAPFYLTKSEFDGESIAKVEAVEIIETRQTEAR